MEKPVKYEDIRNKVKFLAQRMADLFIDFGECLYFIKKDNLWKQWGFKSFEDYIDKELHLNRSSRTARYFLDIYKCLCVKYGLSKSEVKALKWGNAKELPRLDRLGILNRDNLSDWLSKAKNNTQKDFIKEIQKSIIFSDVQLDRSISHTKLFKLDDTQYSNVMMALMMAMQINGVESESFALDMICLDFNSKYAVNLHDDKSVIIKKILAQCAEEFGIKIIAYDKSNLLFGYLNVLQDYFEIEDKALKYLEKDYEAQEELFYRLSDKIANKVKGKIIVRDGKLRFIEL